MSYNEKKYLEDHKQTWKGFVNLSIKGSIIVIIMLALMAIFLTN
ncbi:aa3-type cytochrome c oxidase subunit IV [Alphaproteobacteria bacterium]|nr:aa3-type cytochrome c oxidase subunit IV [Alphaproteobacteria bacterium]